MDSILTNKSKKTITFSQLARLFLRIFSLLIYSFGALSLNFDTMLVAVLIFFSCNIFYCFENFKFMSLFLVFNFVIFVFLLSRPTIDFFKFASLWDKFSDSENMFSLNSIYISLIFLWFGSMLGEKFLKSKNFIESKPVL